jgi:hypothetical protein
LRVVAHARTLCMPPLKAEGVPRIHQVSRNQASRFRAFPATPLPARGAVKAPAPPAPRHGLKRPACQLSKEKNFHHSSIHRPLGDEIGRHSRKRMPPRSHQPCSLFAVSAITRP